MKPIVQAMLIADHVYVDRETGKPIIAGVHRIRKFLKKAPQATEDGSEQQKSNVKGTVSTKFELRQSMGSGMIFLSLTGIHRASHFELRVVRLNDYEVASRVGFAVVCDDPLNVVEIKLPLLPLPQVAGHYAVECLYDDEPIGSYRLEIVEYVEKEKDND